MMEEDMVQADRKTRLRFLLLATVSVLVGLALVLLTEYFFSFSYSDAPQKLLLKLENAHILLYVVAIPTLGIMWIWAMMGVRWGWKILRSGMFPAPGMKVPFNTKRKIGLYAKTMRIFYLVFMPAVALFGTVFLFVISMTISSGI